MADNYVGEIRMFGGTYAPVGWLFCSGQQVSISEYEILYAVIGATYGGDGVTNFQLPDLQSRVPMHYGNGQSSHPLGQPTGAETVTITANHLPPHQHVWTTPVSAGEGDTSNPENAYLANSGSNQYASEATPGAFGPEIPSTASGGGQPHANIQPYLCVNFIIAYSGIFPSPN